LNTLTLFTQHFYFTIHKVEVVYIKQGNYYVVFIVTYLNDCIEERSQQGWVGL